ncbi:hypothetical protein L1049_011885 [Liquidambar formosana]|uniref:RRM domain-containing protein n=1 Tax=Liquidambar formosana TaxID=63359 RepID=A0AAP0RS83_LIQFO
MSASLDMSLDDLIRNNKKPGGLDGNFRGRGRGSSSGPGPARRPMNHGPVRTAPYLMRQPMPMPMQMPGLVLQQQMLMGEGSASETGTKLYVSNLDYGVSNEDIKMLFSEVGDLKRYSIHYDRSGRSKGTAEVVFSRQTDALAAIKRYNNVQLDGKPMKIELVGVNLVTPAVVPPTTNGILGNPTTNGILGNPRGAFRSLQERVGARGWVRGRGSGSGGSRGYGRGRGQGRGRGEKVSAEDLDADLEKYHLESMQIN